MLKKDLVQFFQNNKIAVLLIFLGSLSWSLTMVKSGLLHDFGMGFWGPNGHDGVWHIAVIESLARGSWQMPVFSGEVIKNYHVGFDVILALLYKISGISVTTLYFQIFPPIIALILGFLVYVFVLRWRRSKIQAFWSVFFVYFGGGFGWIVSLIREGRLGGESMFWSQQAISTLLNPPFAMSLVLFVLGLIILIKLHKNFSLSKLVLSAILFGVLVQIKAYAGVLALVGLLVAGIWEFLSKKRKATLAVFAGSFLISMFLILPVSLGGNLFVFKPFWFLETMMQLSDRLNWPRFGEAMVNYKTGNIWYKAIPAYFIAFLIFWYGNMGMRFLAEIKIAKWIVKFRKISFIEVFLICILLAGVVLPLFFLQKGTPWNTIQFFYYCLFFAGILAGVSVGEWFEKKSKTIIYIIVLVFLTVPTSVGTLRAHYLPLRPPAKLSMEELEALKFLEKQPQGVVLTYPFDEEKAKLAESNPPRPLYLYESTAYVSAFSGKPVFLEDEVNLDITGYNWPLRREEVEQFLNTLEQSEARSFLKENSISYVYWLKGQRAVLDEGQLGLTKIFENSEVDVYKVKN